MSSMDDEYRTRSNFLRYTNIVEIITPSKPPTIKYIKNLGIHEFGREMAKFSIGISHDLMVEKLVF